MAGKPGRSGPKSTFTEAKGAEIIGRIEQGTPPSVAAQACGVPASTFKLWRDTYPDFAESVERARAEFESKAVEAITLAGSEDWKALAWHLERQYQARYAVKVKVVREDEANKLLEVAERVLERKDFSRLLEALAAEDSSSAAGEAESGRPDWSH